jgi:hypothetical protein
MIISSNTSLIFAYVVIRFRDLNYDKRENLRFPLPCLDYKLSENKQGQEMVELLQQRLLRSQQRMKASWQEQNRKIFVVGDKFWLKLQLYVHTSVAKHANHKLSFRYFGPFEFESKIGSVAYKLKMPTLSNIHLVFHVSLLKKVIGDITLTTHVLPPKASCISTEVPEIVWDQRLKTKNKRVVSQLLIKWRDWQAEMATWEDEDTYWLRYVLRLVDKTDLEEGMISRESSSSVYPFSTKYERIICR